MPIIGTTLIRRGPNDLYNATAPSSCTVRVMQSSTPLYGDTPTVATCGDNTARKHAMVLLSVRDARTALQSSNKRYR
jgi:hypothetical protein